MNGQSNLNIQLPTVPLPIPEALSCASEGDASGGGLPLRARTFLYPPQVESAGRVIAPWGVSAGAWRWSSPLTGAIAL